MKRFLLVFFSFCILCFKNVVQAQCTVSNATVTNVVRTENSPGSNLAKLTFDLTFTMQNNNGNKTISIHLWPGASYPSPAINYGAKPPTAAQLSGSYGTIVIDNGVSNPTFYSTYPFGAGVNILTTDPTIYRTGGGNNSTPFQITIKDITVNNVPNQGGIVIRGDIWSTNSGSLNSNTNPQCWTQNIYLGVGDPSITGFLVCGNPRMLDFLVSTESTTSINATYKVLKDDGVFDADNQPILDFASDVDVTLPGSTAFSVVNNDPFGDENSEASDGVIGFAGSSTKPSSEADYWLLVTYTTPTGATSSVARFMANGCTALPVHFKLFSADRKNASTVTLKWTTAMEQNNRGFYVQRYVGGDWKNVAFVFSQADGSGNSSSDLSYEYFDRNEEKGISQYRIQQVDLDYKATYSDIRAIKGEGAVNKVTIYPNPSSDGKVSVVFDNTSSLKDVQVSDLQGRTIKMYAAVKGNVLVIDELKTGFYTLKITDRSTAVSSVEKVVVK